MSTIAQIATQQTEERATQADIQKIYDDFGCNVNAIDVNDLFARYGEFGFLYPEKLRRLKPFLPEILSNWQKAMQYGSQIHRVVTYEDPACEGWASISSWRSTTTGWTTQHLVSTGNPVASRSVMIAEGTANQRQYNHDSNNNWFRPENRMPQRIFGSIVDTLGAENAWVDCFNYVEVTPLSQASLPTGVSVVECSAETQHSLYGLALECRGAVYSEAEELDGDLHLSKLDAIYQEVGLRRYRRAWLALDELTGRPLAGLISYRGPLGLNFSFLENRSELLVAKGIADEDLEGIIGSLIAAASDEYESFSPGFIPVIADDRCARVLQLRGDKIVRQYCRSVWQKAGYAGWVGHTSQFYARIMHRLARRKAKYAK